MLAKKKKFWLSSIAPYYASGGGGGSPASVAFIGADAQNIGFGSSTYTSPSFTWTTGHAVVCVEDESNRGSLSVTINGVAATNIAYGPTNNKTSLWYAAVTAGSGTIVITAGAAFSNVAVNAYVVTSTSATPNSSSIIDMLVASEPQSGASITIPASGIGIAFASVGFGPSTFPATWSGTGLTREAGSEVTSSGGNGNGMCSASSTTSGAVTPSVTCNGSFNFMGNAGQMAAVTWGP